MPPLSTKHVVLHMIGPGLKMFKTRMLLVAALSDLGCNGLIAEK